ncbi:MAG: hypothetical protein ACFE8P_12890, partial [Promethearchaeota archaeon]
MLKKKKNRILFLSLLGLFFILLCNNSIIEGKGVSQTLEANSGVISPFYGFPGDEVIITFNVTKGSFINVYILDNSPGLLSGVPTSNIVASNIDFSGSVIYTISEWKVYYVVFYNIDSSMITFEHNFQYIPKISLIITIIIIVSVVSIGTLIIFNIRSSLKKRKIRRDSSSKKTDGRLGKDEEFINKKKQKQKMKELKKMKQLNPK